MVRITNRIPLSKTEEKVWAYLLGYFTDYGYMPTRREIATHMDYASNHGVQTVQYLLNNMQKKKWVTLGKGWRNIKIVELTK